MNVLLQTARSGDFIFIIVPNPFNMPDQLFTRKQFANYLNVCIRTVYALEKNGTVIPVAYINKSPRYTKESFQFKTKGAANGKDSK